MAPTVSVIAKVAYIYDSQRFEVGAVLSMRDDDHLQAALAAGQVEKYDLPAASAEGGESLQGEALLESLGELWDVDMTPEAYLSQFPAGPSAELANRIIEAKAQLKGPVS